MLYIKLPQLPIVHSIQEPFLSSSIVPSFLISNLQSLKMSARPEAQSASESKVPIDDPDVPKGRKAFVPLGTLLAELYSIRVD